MNSAMRHSQDLAFAEKAGSIRTAEGVGQVDDISIRHALAVPTLCMVIMIAVAAAVASLTGVDGTRVFWPYLSGWASATILTILVWTLLRTASMAARREDDPIRKLATTLWGKLPLFIIPALIFPLFLGAYTWAKASIPFTVGYPWESFWADVDHALLRADGWRIAHALMPSSFALAWTLFYAIGWGLLLVFVGALVSAFADRRAVATFYTAMMLSWLIGGVVFAYALSCAGPVFAHLADPALAERFAPLRAELQASLAPDNIVLTTQRYLAAGIDSRIALKGSGISAMPSMHIATATIFVLAARRTKWMPLALLFWLMTFFGSVYLGYHYAVDAPVAVAVAIPCWMLARRIYRPQGQPATGALQMPAAPSPA